MRRVKRAFYSLTDFVREIFLVLRLLIPQLRNRSRMPEIPVIASLTSYPPRIGSAWIAIETLLRQSVRPRKLLLVLNEQEFPGRILPRRIRSQAKRGLEILWLPQNGRSYDKLLPIRNRYPLDTVVTFDDDKFFPPRLLEDLFEASLQNGNSVIGSRGWIIRKSKSGINYGEGWERAISGARGKTLITPGGNGCLYPPKSLDANVDNLEEALQICPTADDIWFWCAIQKNGTDIVCLGYPPHRPVRSLRTTVALSAQNESENNTQFQRALDFWKIRELVNDSVGRDQ